MSLAREGDREPESRCLKRQVAVSYPRTLVRNYLNGPPLYPQNLEPNIHNDEGISGNDDVGGGKSSDVQYGRAHES